MEHYLNGQPVWMIRPELVNFQIKQAKKCGSTSPEPAAKIIKTCTMQAAKDLALNFTTEHLQNLTLEDLDWFADLPDAEILGEEVAHGAHGTMLSQS
jgi:aconitase A